MARLSRLLSPIAIVALAASVLAARQAASTEGQKHWGYSAEGGAIPPSAWGTVPGAALCGTGHQQSPIDLSSKAPVGTSAGLTFDYRASSLAIVNNGHTVQMNTDPGSTISVGGRTYKLAQFHLHAPSEHTIDGQHLPLEIHFVHVNDANQPAVVVGVMVRSGSANSTLDPVMARLPGEEGKTTTFSGPIALAQVLPSSGGFWHYAGSLTTPPCTEGMQWYVMDSPIDMSRQEISAFTSLGHMAHTDRPIQALGDRKVERLAR